MSDGFSCLNIIKQKYDRKFISEVTKHIIIRAFKPNDYDISIEEEDIDRVYISIFPTKEQSEHIIKTTERKKNIEMYIIVPKKQIKSYGSSFSIRNLNTVFKNYDNSKNISEN